MSMYPEPYEPWSDPLNDVEDGLVEPLPGDPHAHLDLWEQGFQQARPLDGPPDMFDRLEQSIERDIEPSPTEEHFLMDNLEASIEGRDVPLDEMIPLPDPIDEGHVEFADQGVDTDHPLAGLAELSPVREFGMPERRSRGGSTGIRGSGVFCSLRDEWVDGDDCEDCGEFEDDGHGGCEHSA